MKLRKLSTSLIAVCLLSLAVPAFADNVGVNFQGDDAVATGISQALKADGHQIVDIATAARSAKQLDSVAAASIGRSTGADIIVSGKKIGAVIVIKILSTKNDTVVGGTANSGAAAADLVKKLIAENKSKLSR